MRRPKMSVGSGSRFTSSCFGRSGRRLLPLLAVLFIAGSLPAGEETSIPFSSAMNIATSVDGPTSVSPADIDGDGDTDVFAALMEQGEVAVYVNDGDGTSFTARTVTTALAAPTVVLAADVDGDGDMDVIVVDPWADTLVWYENAFGSGIVWIPHVIGMPILLRGDTGASFADVTAADLDGDGDLDVAATRRSGEVLWFENTDGLGTMWDTRLVDTDDTFEGIASGDVNGDGHIDLVAVSPEATPRGCDGEVFFYENDGGAPPTFMRGTVENFFCGGQAVALGDIDCDGDLDVVASDLSFDEISWFENQDGAGTSWNRDCVDPNAMDCRSLEVVDLDRDGDPDILGADRGGLFWQENLLDQVVRGGNNCAFLRRDIDPGLGAVLCARAADLDDDGDRDVVTCSFGGDRIFWYAALTIHQSALFPAAIIVDATAPGAREVAAGDIDGDGHQDLVGVSPDDSRVAWHQINGDGSSWIERLVASIADVEAVDVGDIDGDGALDVVSGGGSLIIWHRNVNGDGTLWSSIVVSAVAVGVQSVHMADVDGDGDSDILSATVNDNTIAWFENTGGGATFTRRVISALAFGARDVQACDLDADGDLDVVSASSNDNEITWYENLGSTPPLFTERIISNQAETAFAVCCADLDGDGDMDVVSASVANDLVAWFENNGARPPVFTPRLVSNFVDGARSVCVADLDKDGDIDIISSSLDDDKVSWHENDGGSPPTFTSRTITADFINPVSVVACDIDKDGCIDVASAALIAGNVAWYRNRGGQFGLATTNLAGLRLDQGQTGGMLAIDLLHRGRTGDSDVELACVEVRLIDQAGTPLTEPQAEALFARIQVYADDGSGVLETGVDEVLAEVTDLTLVAGVQKITLPDDDPRSQTAFGEPAPRYFVAVELQPDAGIQAQRQFAITHVTDTSSRGEDASTDMPLKLEAVASFTSRVVLSTARTFDCRKGNVDSRLGPPANVLLVNGSPGVNDNERTVCLTPATPLSITVDPPPSRGISPTKYVIYAWNRGPANGLAVDLPQNVGCFGLAPPFGLRTPKPLRRANTLGFEAMLGTTNWPVPIGLAPTKLLDLAGGTGLTGTFYLQGIIENVESPQGAYAVTNGVVVKVQ